MKTIKNQITYLGYYQIIGGVIGLALILWLIIGSFGNGLAMTILPIYLFMLLPFLLSVYAGYQCVKLRSNALLWSKINQILQVLHVGLGAFAFQYCTGVYLGIGVDLTGDLIFTFDFGISKINFSFNSGSGRNYLVINLVAFYLIYFIKKLESQLVEHESILQDETPNIEVLDAEL